MSNRFGGVLVGFAAIVTAAAGMLAARAMVRPDDGVPVVGLAVGLIVVAAAMLGLVGGLVLYQQPRTLGGVGLLATDRAAAVLITLVALVAGYVGIDGLSTCSRDVEFCVIGVMVGGLFIFVGLVGVGLSLAILKQPTIGRLLGVLATGFAFAWVVGSTVTSIEYGSSHRIDGAQIALSSALGASLFLLAASMLQWLRRSPW